MKNKPEFTLETLQRMEDMTWFTSAQIFDDLVIVAQKETCCYVLKTQTGLVVIDGIWPDVRIYDAIIQAVKEAGWEDIPFAKFLITHGHIDHVGCAKWFVDAFRVETYLSEEDNGLRHSTPHEAGRSDAWKEFAITHYLQDGEVIDCGDKRIIVMETKGHTDGCMSFIFPVKDNGEVHTACLFGGATPRKDNPGDADTQMKSVDAFMEASREYYADVLLTNHTIFDNGLERIAYSRKRMSYLPNIYVIGIEGVQKFGQMFKSLCEIAEEPIMEESATEEPMVEEPVAEEPVMEEPVAEEPVMEEPVMEESVTEAPVAEEPAIVSYLPLVSAVSEEKAEESQEEVTEVFEEDVTEVFEEEETEVFEEDVTEVFEEEVTEVFEEDVTEVFEEDVTEVFDEDETEIFEEQSAPASDQTSSSQDEFDFAKEVEAGDMGTSSEETPKSEEEPTVACPACWAPNKTDSKFCCKCGFALTSGEKKGVYPDCGEVAKDSKAKFCWKCGGKLMK